MATALEYEVLETFKKLVETGQYSEANTKLNAIKGILLEFDSLPPLNADSPNAQAQRLYARDALEYTVILSVGLGDKFSFERIVNSLRPYYTGTFNLPESSTTSTVLGLNLLFLLVENRLADFHSELELLKDSQLEHPYIVFCTQLDQHLVVGSYNQVLNAASHPPVALYSFFLNSLLETVRLNIGDCIGAAYDKLTLEAATKILMFSNPKETLDFIQNNHGEWTIENDVIYFKVNKTMKSDELPALKLISQTLTYATELERIV